MYNCTPCERTQEHLQRRRRIDFAEKTLGVALFLLVGTVVWPAAL